MMVGSKEHFKSHQVHISRCDHNFTGGTCVADNPLSPLAAVWPLVQVLAICKVETNYLSLSWICNLRPLTQIYQLPPNSVGNEWKIIGTPYFFKNVNLILIQLFP